MAVAKPLAARSLEPVGNSILKDQSFISCSGKCGEECMASATQRQLPPAPLITTATLPLPLPLPSPAPAPAPAPAVVPLRPTCSRYLSAYLFLILPLSLPPRHKTQSHSSSLLLESSFTASCFDLCSSAIFLGTIRRNETFEGSTG